jgi:hypothetical protein
MTKPNLPEFASTLVDDAISNKSNVAEPSNEKKQIGWSRNEKPKRQYFNWIARQTYLCLKYLFDNKSNVEQLTKNEILAKTVSENIGVMYYCSDHKSGVLVYSNGSIWKNATTGFDISNES